jgi:peptidoglycan/LPS O-acetylase OafA/YrhL
MNKIEKIKYPSINGLRAVSIIFVVIHHLSIKNNIFQGVTEYKWLSPFTSFLSDGHLGVNVFFVISGFLITSLLLQEEMQWKTISLKNFYIRRTLRIFPAYYFLLLVYFIFQLFDFIHIKNSSWFTALTYTKYFNWYSDWVTAHAWSLSIEEHFYIFWPLIFKSGDKIRKWTPIILVILVPIIRTIVYFHPIAHVNELTIFTRIDAIAIGCLFALFKKDILKIISPHWSKIFYISIFILFSLRYYPFIADEIHSGLSIIFKPFDLTNGTIASFLISLIMMYSIFGPQKRWFKILNLPILNYIGLLSYSIYLWQQVFISGSKYWVTKFPQNLIFLFLMSMFSYYIVEKPFLKLKKKFSYTKLYGHLKRTKKT